MTWEPIGIGQHITDFRIFGDFNRPLLGTVPSLQDDPNWDPTNINPCPLCNTDREMENASEYRLNDKAEETPEGEPENGLENDAEPEKDPKMDPEIPPPTNQTKPIPNNVATTPERTTIFVTCDFFREATGRVIARGGRPCDINPEDPRTRLVKEPGSPGTERARMLNAARVRKCRERAALGLITPGVGRPIGSKSRTRRGRRKVKKP